MKDLNENNGLNGNDGREETSADAPAMEEAASAFLEPAVADKEKKKKKLANGEEKTYKLPFFKTPVKKTALIKIICIASAAVLAAVALILGLVLGLRGGGSEYTVTFAPCAHVEYSCERLGEANASGGSFTVKEGEKVTFSLSVEEGYAQTPHVTANGSALSAVSGAYTVTVTENVTVEVSEVFEVAVALEGSGTKESPWLLTSARDINFVAQNVNGGVPAYIQGYYALKNDIDCNGAELNVIGNGRTQASFFGGYFDGRGHVVSNYVINARGIDYAGFFGYVQISGTGTDELGTVTNLHLRDFTLNAYSADTSNVFAGALIGYSSAAQLVGCSAVNGQMNIFGSSYFCYVGGAVGAQQSAHATATDGSLFPFYCVVNKVHTDVDIYVGSGFVYGAGGITGYVYSEHEMAHSFITDSYAEGDILGAMRAGGIAGYLDDYSSIAGCYSTGEIEAYTRIAEDGATSDYSAYAGGIAGYAGINTVISDSFSTSKTYARSTNGSKFGHAGGIVGGNGEKTYTARAVVIQNSENLGFAPSADYVKNTLGWRNCDWTVTDGALPEINFAKGEANTFTVALNYTGNSVDGQTSQNVTVTADEDGTYYVPLSDYFFAEVPAFERSYSSVDGKTSYGYFFDEEKTKQVPYGYIPLRNTSLYIAFADYNDVVGVYYYNKNGRTVALTLDVMGEYAYEDALTQYASYTYDGEKIIIYDALFARYSREKEEDSPNLNYEAYHFAGVKTADGIKFYDGKYFTEAEAIQFSKTNSSATANPFVGVWEKSATVNKKYVFTDTGWTLKRGNNVLDGGSYTVSDGTATLKSGLTAKIDASGLLLVGDEYFCYENSLFGTWFDNLSGSYVVFDGYGSNLAGEVMINLGNSVQRLLYVKDGFFDVDGSPCVTILNADTLTLFGYLALNKNVLGGVLFSTAAGGFVSVDNFRLIDDYTGEWIGEEAGAYKILNFNGLGIYKVENAGGTVENLGYVEIDGERYEYTVDVENGLKGSFYIGGIKYSLEYDDDNKTVTVSDGSVSNVFGRKDIMYSYPLTDDNGNVYTFNGGSGLSIGGVLTVTKPDGTSAKYAYKITDSVTDADNNLKDITVNLENGSGSITVKDNKFIFKMGAAEETLYLDLPYSSSVPWAVSDYFNNFTIGKFDLSYTAKGTFMGMSGEATYTYNRNGGYVSVPYIVGEMTQYVTEYLIMLADGNIAISSYPYLVAGDYRYAAPQDEMYYIPWYDTQNGKRILRFDGLADSKYTQGVVYELVGNKQVETYLYTRRFGKLYMWKYDDENVAYVLEPVPHTATGENIFNNGGRVSYKLAEFDVVKMPVFEASDGETEYKFYFDGSFTKDGKGGAYELLDADSDKVSFVVHMAGEDDRTAEADLSNNTIRFIG